MFICIFSCFVQLVEMVVAFGLILFLETNSKLIQICLDVFDNVFVVKY